MFKLSRLIGLTVIAFLAILSISPSYAQECSNPAGVIGSVTYNESYDVFQGCSKNGWQAFLRPPCPNGDGCDPCHPMHSAPPGTVCFDGTVFAGVSPDGSTSMFTTSLDAGAFSFHNGTADCQASSANCVDTPLENCVDDPPGTAPTCRTGASNSITLATAANIESPYNAAVFCNDLEAHGHDDWYLPAQDELAVLYQYRNDIGGFNLTGPFASTSYLSSSEQHQIAAVRVRFTDGNILTVHKHVSLSVRCVRKELL